MEPRTRVRVVIALAVAFGSASQEASAQSTASRGAPPSSIPTVSLNNVARHGFVYAGGRYVGELGPNKESTMGGAMYVEVMVPKQIRSPYPIVFLHGAGQTAVDWLQPPDGRPGWAYNFLDLGYVVYLEDYPARGRSQYVPGVDGTPERPNLNIRTAPNLEETFTASAARGDFPQAKKHNQWPGTGRMGDKIFDDFAKTQVQFLAGGRQDTLTRDANVALLDMIGTPVILLTHSQGGAFGWLVADARPKEHDDLNGACGSLTDHVVLSATCCVLSAHGIRAVCGKPEPSTKHAAPQHAEASATLRQAQGRPERSRRTSGGSLEPQRGGGAPRK